MHSLLFVPSLLSLTHSPSHSESTSAVSLRHSVFHRHAQSSRLLLGLFVLKSRPSSSFSSTTQGRPAILNLVSNVDNDVSSDTFLEDFTVSERESQRIEREPPHSDMDEEDYSYEISELEDWLDICSTCSSHVSTDGKFSSPASSPMMATCIVDNNLKACGLLSPSATTVSPQFVSDLRMGSPYIEHHRESTFVVHIPAQIIECLQFESLMQDLVLTSQLGIRLVLVVGSRYFVNRRLKELGIENKKVREFRVTDYNVLQLVKEYTGSVMWAVQSKLSRGVPNSPGGGESWVNVVSGNFFSAQPVGVIDGIDTQYAGLVRKIHVETINERLDRGDIVILTAIGYSNSGDALNCKSEDVAAVCAAQLKAEKLVFFTEGDALYDIKERKIIRNLPLKDAKNLLQRDDIPEDLQLYINFSVKALTMGVLRAHVLDWQQDGSLLQEVFHREGSGFMISRDIYEGIRSAVPSDVDGVKKLIAPLEEQGILVPRSQRVLEQEISNFVVIERDKLIIACAALVKFPEDPTIAELGCLAVHPNYRKAGKASALLSYLERKSYALGLRRLFILSTVTFQWFLERGFKSATVDQLPKSKREKYNQNRRSRVFIKELEGESSVDEQDLFERLS